ncbi:phage portal protein [Micromonospora provocatoris]
MGLLNKIFGSKKQPENTTRLELLNDTNSGFFSWSGNTYQSDIVRACIRPKAKAIGKLNAKHIRDSTDDFKINPDPWIRIILEEPNPLMTGQMFQEKMAVQLELNNNAFAYIKRDEAGYPLEVYPIPASLVEVIEGTIGDIFLKFFFNNGSQMTVPYVDIIHLRQDFNENDFFGESPAVSLTPLMEIVNTTDQGIVKAIKNSNVIRWLLKFMTALKPTDVKKQAEQFVETFLSTESKSIGVAATDTKMDVQQIKPNDYVPNEKQMENTIKRIYSFFNTNEKIVMSTFNEDEWTAYYESVIEPIAMQLSGEFTRKFFTRRERGFGNKILFESSSLQYASMKTKMNLVQMVDRGALTPNEWRSILSLAPIEGGNKPVRRLDTAQVEDGNVIKNEGGDEDESNGEEGTNNGSN